VAAAELAGLVDEGGVIEGRDIGSVVFPDAELKLYLTADPEVRAQRRHKEVADLAYEEVAAAMAERDALDASRTHSPLVEAQGATVIDTTGRAVEEIIDEIVAMLDRR
jgi:cytidylate kinase